ncbi:MAG: YihA family ribosome biogenesis GTP-binding protein [Verrucomicrobia bacterium]|nr:YihA family ribosome biogenesis GTP-binding protein [Verrucomicrobiota bacterium]
MKKIPFSQAQFIASAFDAKSFPRMTTSGGNPMPEIALVGRSNVGKSSLINHLLRNSNLAKTSSTPGKTKSINFFSIDEQLALVDLPGYGYAKVPKDIREQWSGMIDHYLQTRTTLRLILFLLDSRRDPTEEDCALMKWAAFHNKPMLLVFTKADKMTDSEIKEKTLSTLDSLKNFLHSAPVYFLHYSIKDPRARMELIEKINSLIKEHGANQ